MKMLSNISINISVYKQQSEKVSIIAEQKWSVNF